METLVVVAQHRNHQYSRTKANGGLAAGFESSPSRCFREISCRTFQSGAAGILPTPLKARKTAEIVQAPPAAAAAGSVSDETYLKPKAGSTPIPIKAKPVNNENFFYDEFSSGSMSFAELWAGPAYSNSPPPSSLPIPKFSLRPKRTVSLDLPSSASDDVVMHHPIAKSAPSSPTGDRKLSSKAFFHSADSATQTLRRILNLDATDD